MRQVTAVAVLMWCFLSAASAQDAQRSPRRAPSATAPMDARPPRRSCRSPACRASYIASQMRALRDGKRPATVMHQIAKGYTDPQIDALAAWFSAQKR